MRLVTFNVLHGRSTVDGRVDLDRFADAVRVLDADVLALQEVDRRQPRSGGADLTAVAAQAGGYGQSLFVPALTGLPGSWRAARATGDQREPQYGVALLNRVRARAWRSVRLPPLPVPVPVVFGGRRLRIVRDEPRVAAVAELLTPSGPVTVASTHLSFLAGWNVLQLRRLVRALGDTPRLVLAGDLNMPPDRAVRACGLRPLAPGLTFPAGAPVRQLDHVLARGGLSGQDARVWPLPLSDHCALGVTVSA